MTQPDSQYLLDALERLVAASAELGRAAAQARQALVRVGRPDDSLAIELLHRVVATLGPLPAAQRHERVRAGFGAARQRGTRVGRPPRKTPRNPEVGEAA